MSLIKKRVTDAAKGMALFGLLGPPLGALFFTPVAFMWELDISDSYLLAFFMVYETLTYTMLFSYIVAGIPALATGLVAGLVRRRIRHFGHCLLIGVAGGLISMGLITWTFAGRFEFGEMSDYFGPLGFMSSTVCALFFRVKTSASSLTPPSRQQVGVAVKEAS